MTLMETEALIPAIRDRMRSELRALQRSGTFDVLFGGGVDRQRLHLSDFSGTRSRVLRGLVIQAQRGAGGRALVERRPVRVDHYRTAPIITHDYDREIATEGIQALVAAPILVKGRTRGVLYGGLRRSVTLGDGPVGELESAASALAYQFAVQDEVGFRLRALADTLRDPGERRDPRVSEAISEGYLALQEIAEVVDDPELRARISRVEQSLRRLGRPSDEPVVRLTHREVDVLSYASLGCGNTEIADRLGLSRDTVKTYMRNLMAKLGVKSRHAAVVEARRQGIIP